MLLLRWYGSWLSRTCLVVGEGVLSIAETYRAMSDDIERAATEVDDEEVRRAYLALAEIWRKRAEGLPAVVDEHERPRIVAPVNAPPCRIEY
jgi:hypothetical protein